MGDRSRTPPKSRSRRPCAQQAQSQAQAMGQQHGQQPRPPQPVQSVHCPPSTSTRSVHRPPQEMKQKLQQIPLQEQAQLNALKHKRQHQPWGHIRSPDSECTTMAVKLKDLDR
eukprot:4728018-Amphidinium_carterae.1